MTHAYVEVRGLSKAFGAFRALGDISLAIGRGEFVCFLGPSGCGKTTLLRCLAGLETPSAGRIVQDGRDITRAPASRRDFGIVFQSYALFPNLSISDNVAFGLVNAGRPAGEIRNRVEELLALVGLQGQQRKYPSQLSGGQQQRVALARALAPSPGLLLLDEPLSALDAKVRARLRREIRDLQKRVGVTTIMVTHDQEEAQTMADRIVVMNEGGIEQVGTPAEVYDAPATAFVADFIGVMNFIDARMGEGGLVSAGPVTLPVPAARFAPGTALRLAVRPEHVQVHSGAAAAADAPQGVATLRATVTGAETLGAFRRVYLRVSGLEAELAADLRGHEDRLAAGDPVSLRLDPARLLLFPAAA